MMSRRDLMTAAAGTIAAASTGMASSAAETQNPFKTISKIDYTIIYVRDMAAMRGFYEKVMSFELQRELSTGWLEYNIGGNILTLAVPHFTKDDAPVPPKSAALQLAFKVLPKNVDACAEALQKAGIPLVSPPTDQSWGHRTLFFRDPDGNLLEIYADI